MKRLRLIVAKEGGEKCSPSLIGFLGANFLVVWCGAVCYGRGKGPHRVRRRDHVNQSSNPRKIYTLKSHGRENRIVQYLIQSVNQLQGSPPSDTPKVNAALARNAGSSQNRSLILLTPRSPHVVIRVLVAVKQEWP